LGLISADKKSGVAAGIERDGISKMAVVLEVGFLCHQASVEKQLPVN
jgi:hypothetical protein